VAIKTGKASETNPKRLSKGKRMHVRRLKQEARKSPGALRAQPVSARIPHSESHSSEEK
jgi:hypothetical protein